MIFTTKVKLFLKKNSPSDIKNILLYFTNKDYTLINLEDGKKDITNIDAFVEEFKTGLYSQTNILALPN